MNIQQFFSYLIILIFCNCASPPKDISVGEIRVIQAVEGSRLVKNKPMVVRVQVKTLREEVKNVSGDMKIYDENGNEIKASIFLAPKKITAPVTTNWGDENHTLNFLVDDIKYSNRDIEKLNFKVKVEYKNDPNLADNLNNKIVSISSNSLSPKVNIVKILYNTNTNSEFELSRGPALAKSIFPFSLNKENKSLEQQIVPHIFNFQESFADNILNKPEERAALITDLASINAAFTTADGTGCSNNENCYVYGFVNEGAFDSETSLSHVNIGKRRGFGTSSINLTQSLFAQDLAKLLNSGIQGLPDEIAPNLGWDVNGELIDEDQGITNRVKTTDKIDILSYNPTFSTKDVWISQASYNSLINPNTSHIFALRRNLDFSLAEEIGDTTIQNELLVERVVEIVGVINSKRSEIIRLNPIVRYSWKSKPTSSNPRGGFEVIAKTNGNPKEIVSQFFDISRDSVDAGFFKISLPVPPEREIDTLTIINRRSKKILKQIVRTSPPSIRNISPKNHSKLKNTVVISWTVEDDSTNSKDLYKQVLFSPDNGKSWMPIVAKTKTNSVTISTKDLPQIVKDGQGVIKVSVRDELNTVSSEIVGLSIRNESFIDKIVNWLKEKVFKSSIFKGYSIKQIKNIEDNTEFKSGNKLSTK